MLSLAEASRLASLRRLYHHLANGGQPGPHDAERVGCEVTVEALARQIETLEQQQTSRGDSRK